MYIISASPHIHTVRKTSMAMWHVIIALIPALFCAIYYFGIGAAIVAATSVTGCIATEYIINRYMFNRESTIANGSAVLTGLLLAFNLPSNLPVWIVLIGAVFSIGVVKMAFGGLGCNIFNPAIAGRVFLLISFPVQMTSWPIPGVNWFEYTDATTGATILSSMKMNQIDPESIDLISKAVGNAGGSLGEVGAFALLLGFAYLLAMRIISWHIPVSILATVALFTWAIGGYPVIELLSGGLMLGAIFMATDYVTSPMTHKAMIVYGIFIGVITVIIRYWGAYPEGVSFAILIMNGCTPLLNRWMKPNLFGERRKATV